MSLGLVLNVPWLKIASVVTATVLTWNTGYVGAPSLKEGWCNRQSYFLALLSLTHVLILCTILSPSHTYAHILFLVT